MSATVKSNNTDASKSVLLQDMQALQQVRDALNSVLKGKEEVVENVLICLISRGHLLLEDRPGLGKTTLAKALATAVGGHFARMQCTPDLLPSDITGFSIFNQKSHEFEFRPGPVFSDVLLADEINRATPRTQSALLEAMAERQVTVDTQRHPLADDFFVIATQNPMDQHGTYPLPEAQLDRFAMKLSVGYPQAADEVRMLAESVTRSGDDDSSDAVMESGQLQRVQSEVSQLYVAPTLQEYLVTLAAATRNHPHISLGLSPRGVLIWQRTAQARAYLQQRDFVTPDDISHLARPVLSVRLGVDHDDPLPVIDDVLQSVPVPEYREP